MTCKEKIVQLIMASPILRARPEITKEDINELKEEDIVKLFNKILRKESKIQENLLNELYERRK